MKSRAKKIVALYEEAEARLEASTGDLRDEVLVSLVRQVIAQGDTIKEMARASKKCAAIAEKNKDEHNKKLFFMDCPLF